MTQVPVGAVVQIIPDRSAKNGKGEAASGNEWRCSRCKRSAATATADNCHESCKGSAAAATADSCHQGCKRNAAAATADKCHHARDATFQLTHRRTNADGWSDCRRPAKSETRSEQTLITSALAGVGSIKFLIADG